MTTYPIDFVGLTPATQRLVLNNRQSVTESTTTFASQVVQTGAQWVLTWTWPATNFATAEYIHAWVLSLQGQVGTFNYYPIMSQSCSLTGITLAQQAFQYGSAVQATGWTAGQASGLRVGQYLQIGTQLLAIQSVAANADGNGQVTIGVAPQLRSNVASGTAINFANPCGIFRLNASTDLGFTLDPDQAPTFGTMTAREVI